MYFHLPNHCSFTSQTIVKSCISCVSCISNKSLGIWYNCWKKQQKTAKCKSSPPSTRGALAAPPAPPRALILVPPRRRLVFWSKPAICFAHFIFKKRIFYKGKCRIIKKNCFGLFAAPQFFSDFLLRPFPADVKGTLLNPEGLAARTLKQIDFEIRFRKSISKIDFEIREHRFVFFRFLCAVFFAALLRVLCDVCCTFVCTKPQTKKPAAP